MTRSHSDLLWPVERLPDALEQLAQRQGYGRAAGEIAPPAAAVEPSRVWMFALGDRLGVELEPITPLYHELPDVLERAAPCILQVRRDGVPSYLVLLGTRRGKLRLLARDLPRGRGVAAGRQELRRVEWSTVLPVGVALRRRLAPAGVLRASRRRTVSVAGRTRGVGPVSGR